MVNELTNQIDLNKVKQFESADFGKQKEFLAKSLDKSVNLGLNLGLQKIFTDVSDRGLTNIRNNIITDQIKIGIKNTIDNVIDNGKKVLENFKEKFENIPQVKMTIQKSDVIKAISTILDCGIKVAKQKKLISSSVAMIIKDGKNIILNSVKNSIEDNLTSQIQSVEKIDRYISRWKKYFKEERFSDMDRQYKNIKEEMQNIVPLEDIIKEARQLENLHNLIKNNGKNFNLSAEEISLAKNLI